MRTLRILFLLLSLWGTASPIQAADALLLMSSDELIDAFHQGDDCAHWVWQAQEIPHFAEEAKKHRSSAKEARAFLHRVFLLDRPDQVPPTSVEYQVMSFMIERALVNEHVQLIKTGVLERCRRYKPEYVSHTDGGSRYPDPQLIGAE